MAIYFRNPTLKNLSQCRGIETIDRNQLIILVKESVESSARAFSLLKQMTVWERDAYNREIVINQDSTFVFKLQEHLWSIIFKASLLSNKSILLCEDAQSLSRILSTDAIYYRGSDTMGISHYHFFSNGISAEKFHYEDGTAEFHSLLRQIDVSEIRAYNFTNDFIQEQNAYVPLLMLGNYPEDEKEFVPGNRTILRFENLSPSEVARMDYLAENSTQ
jgi:hypothetical protein